jgi:hypothetical protein
MLIFFVLCLLINNLLKCFLNYQKTIQTIQTIQKQHKYIIINKLIK